MIRNTLLLLLLLLMIMKLIFLQQLGDNNDEEEDAEHDRVKPEGPSMMKGKEEIGKV